jgi:tRNA splicing ligase
MRIVERGWNKYVANGEMLIVERYNELHCTVPILVTSL